MAKKPQNCSGQSLPKRGLRIRVEYKGYVGKVTFDTDANKITVKLLNINIRDVITFEGTTIDEAQQAFKDSIED